MKNTVAHPATSETAAEAEGRDLRLAREAKRREEDARAVEQKNEAVLTRSRSLLARKLDALGISPHTYGGAVEATSTPGTVDDGAPNPERPPPAATLPEPPKRRRRARARIVNTAKGPAIIDSPAGRPPPDTGRTALTKNPRKLAYHRTQTAIACSALARANAEARRGEVQWLRIPREVHHLAKDICDDIGAVAGALDWVRKHRGGPAVALELEAACLYRERGGVQHDDWSCLRARRKCAFLVVLLMSPYEMPRSSVTGSTSQEAVLVTAGVPQTFFRTLLRSSQREPYHVRTLQRDMAEIDECTDLLQRWRTPAAHAQPWEHAGEHGTLNRYCIRVAMVREQWRRALSSAEALVKHFALSSSGRLVWAPAPPRGEPVCWERGGLLVPS